VKHLLLALSLSLVLLSPPALAQSFVGPAFVQPDASLIVNGRRFVLADIEIMPAGRTCDTKLLPPVCGAPAALALRAAVQHFVSCSRRIDLPDPHAATCRHTPPYPAGSEDLGAFLIRQGWAKALPGARPLYHTLETIARSQGRGAWGTRLEERINPQPR